MMEMIDESQKDDFRTLIIECGLDPSSFELVSELDQGEVLPHL